MTFPFEKSGDTIHLAGVILHDGPDNQGYAILLPDTNALDAPMEWMEFTSTEWHEWLKNSDDPHYPLYSDEQRTIVKAIIRKATYQVDQNIAWAVYRRAGYVCEYCGAADRPLTYDHYLAQAYGGETTMENGKAACRSCNKVKGHKAIAEWEQYMKDKGWR
jgi:hypothetical protein